MNNYVIVDVETSGLDSDNDEIIKLSALKIVNAEIYDRFFALVKPSKPLTEESQNLTGIENAELTEKRRINDLLSDVLNFIGDNTIVAHNVGFDMKFINAALSKAGIPPIKNKTVDTLELARRKYESDNFSLRSVAKFLGVNYENSADEEITFCVYEKLKR